MACLQCPTCGKPYDSQQTTAPPFCSERCRLIDLGRWLKEEQGLPVTSVEEDEEEPRIQVERDE